MTGQEVLEVIRSDEDIIEDCMTRGGAVMDHELAQLMKEMYELAMEHNVDISI